MTTQRQTDANRRNALLSTGPRTEEGKQQSRCNAYRHGLTAETIVAGLENAADYAAFEAEIVAEFDPKSIVEGELTRRLASLLWRLRRANLIEAGLFCLSRVAPEYRMQASEKRVHHVCRRTNGANPDSLPDDQDPVIEATRESVGERTRHHGNQRQRILTRGFLRLVDIPSQPLDKLNRYELSLWRLFVQSLYALDQAKYHRISATRHRFTPRTPQW